MALGHIGVTERADPDVDSLDLMCTQPWSLRTWSWRHFGPPFRMEVSPPWHAGSRWSKSQSSAGTRQPGNEHVGWVALTILEIALVGRRDVVTTPAMLP